MVIRDKHNSKEGTGRGATLTFLSKDTQDKLVSTITNFVEEKITKEIHAATLCSLSVDGTTDISLCEQMALL